MNNENVAPVADAGPGLIEYQIPHDGVSGGSYSMNLDCSVSSDFDEDDLPLPLPLEEDFFALSGV